MNIGEASQMAGLPVKTIRYYEDIGLVTPDRTENGYRDFRADDLHRLRFLSRARFLGFSLDECRKLVALYTNAGRASRDVRDLAGQHLAEVQSKIAQLRDMEQELQGMIDLCRGDDGADCAILSGLASGGAHCQGAVGGRIDHADAV